MVPGEQVELARQRIRVHGWGNSWHVTNEHTAPEKTSMCGSIGCHHRTDGSQVWKWAERKEWGPEKRQNSGEKWWGLTMTGAKKRHKRCFQEHLLSGQELAMNCALAKKVGQGFQLAWGTTGPCVGCRLHKPWLVWSLSNRLWLHRQVKFYYYSRVKRYIDLITNV